MINNLWIEHLTPATFAALPSFCLNGRSERRKIDKDWGIGEFGNLEKPVRRTEGAGAHEDYSIASFAVHLGGRTL